MIKLQCMKINTKNRTLESACLAITTDDGDEDSRRLFDLIAEIFEKAMNGPRIDFDMRENPPRVSVHK